MVEDWRTKEYSDITEIIRDLMQAEANGDKDAKEVIEYLWKVSARIPAEPPIINGKKFTFVFR